MLCWEGVLTKTEEMKSLTRFYTGHNSIEGFLIFKWDQIYVTKSLFLQRLKHEDFLNIQIGVESIAASRFEYNWLSWQIVSDDKI